MAYEDRTYHGIQGAGSDEDDMQRGISELPAALRDLPPLVDIEV
ncbi:MULTISPECIES: hypothetical protein [unclassified Streptomyces]|nr:MULTISPECIES: hypothetical protein [unclassified Streptomyces]